MHSLLLSLNLLIHTKFLSIDIPPEVSDMTTFTETKSFNSSSFKYSTIDKYGNNISIDKNIKNDQENITIVFLENPKLIDAPTFSAQETFETILSKSSGKTYLRTKSIYKYGVKDEGSSKSEMLDKKSSEEIDKIVEKLQAIDSEVVNEGFELESFFDIDKMLKKRKEAEMVKEGEMNTIIEGLYTYLK